MSACSDGKSLADSVGVMPARLLGRLLLGATLALGTGCVVSPQPSPPFSPELAGDRIGLTDSIELTGDIIGFAAQPGTVDPAGGEVIVTNLDDTLAPSVAQVASDGSFAIAVPGHAGERFRFQAKVDGQRSEPYDLVVDATATVATDLSAASPCLSFAPESWAPFDGAGDARSIVITNGCDGEARIDPPRLRRGKAGFTFSPTGAITLAAGDVATVTIVAKDGGELEDVLFFEVTAPEPELRAVTLTLPDQ
jgi:hypothetical protein